MLNLGALAQAAVKTEPYRYFYGQDLAPAEAIDAINRDFPTLKNAGYLTLRRDFEPKGAFAAFLDELCGPEVAALVSDALAFDLRKNPTLVTVMRWCPKRAGRIHTDSASKLATMLVYLNKHWAHGSAGAIRALKDSQNFDSFALEVTPIAGNFFGFLRSDCSWHGHLPFEGERRVVQITWLDSEQSVARKQRNNALAQMLKSLRPASFMAGAGPQRPT